MLSALPPNRVRKTNHSTVRAAAAASQPRCCRLGHRKAGGPPAAAGEKGGAPDVVAEPAAWRAPDVFTAPALADMLLCYARRRVSQPRPRGPGRDRRILGPPSGAAGEKADRACGKCRSGTAANAVLLCHEIAMESKAPTCSRSTMANERASSRLLIAKQAFARLPWRT